MFTHMLHRDNPFNQIIYTSTLSFMAFRPLAVQFQCVQRTFLIPRYVLQKMVTEVMKECKFLSEVVWNIKVFSQKYFFSFLMWCLLSSRQEFKHCCRKYQYNSLLKKEQKQNSILQHNKLPDVTLKKYRARKYDLHFIAGKSDFNISIFLINNMQSIFQRLKAKLWEHYVYKQRD